MHHKKNLYLTQFYKIPYAASVCSTQLLRNKQRTETEWRDLGQRTGSIILQFLV
jgi:hypothetical protein